MCILKIKTRLCLQVKICINQCSPTCTLNFDMCDIFDTRRNSRWQQTQSRLISCINTEEIGLMFSLLGNIRNLTYGNCQTLTVSAWRDAFTDSRELSFSRQVMKLLLSLSLINGVIICSGFLLCRREANRYFQLPPTFLWLISEVLKPFICLMRRDRRI